MKLLVIASTSLLLAGCGESAPARTADARSAASAASAAGEAAARDSAAAFARAFYAWYGPRAQDAGERAAAVVLRERPAALAPELRRALAADEARQDAVAGEIVSLDFDPFVGGQDPCGRYEVGAAARAASGAAQGFDVPVWAVCGGRRGAKPSAVARVARAPGGWAFANFRYDAPGPDLLTTLRELAAADTAR